MNEEFFKFLGELLTNIETKKFLAYTFSVILLISLPTLLSMLKESAISKKLKSIIKSNNVELKNSLDNLSSKIDIISDSKSNILGKENIRLFVLPIYRNISLKAYKDLDLMLNDYDFKNSEKEIKLILRRNISVQFKKAYSILSKYRYVNGHKLSYYVNGKWEHWLYQALEELLFNSDINTDKIRLYIWNLLETSVDSYIDEILQKITE